MQLKINCAGGGIQLGGVRGNHSKFYSSPASF